jgi:hypothetical protein
VKRLLERSDLDGSERALAELLRADEPFREDPFRKRRILVRLSRPGFAHRRWPILRPLFAGMLVSGVAIGALGSAFIASSPKTDVVPTTTSAPPVAPALVVHPPARPRAIAEPAPVEVSAPTPAVAEPTLRTPASPHPVARTSTPYPPGEDPSSVVRAIVALRNQKDPQRASTLLNQYLSKNPSGSLSEDALALSIEAAARDHDPRGVALARRYLERYPQGRYRSFAQKALAELGSDGTRR